MKISTEYILREIAGEYVIIPTGQEAMKFQGLITVNETGAFLWKLLNSDVTKEQLVSRLSREYEIDEKTAEMDVEEFLDILEKHTILKKDE